MEFDFIKEFKGGLEKVHFYIRTPKKHRKIVETGLYAQYPTVEIVDVKDYLDNFPNSTKEIYRQNKDIFGHQTLF